SYGLLRYLNPDIDLDDPDPPIGFNYLGRLGGASGEASSELWRIRTEGLSAIGATAAAIPMALAHTLELNAATVDTETGPALQAGWSWAPSVLDDTQITRLSELWFEALRGICAHVRAGGGGLTPSDIAPAHLSQQQLDELCRHYRVADVLPLTPLQQGLLFHARAAQASGDDVYAVQLAITITGPLDPHRLREALHTVITRHPNLVARFCEEFDEPVQIIPAQPQTPWRYVELDGVDIDEQINQLCAAERAAVCEMADQPAFRAALIRTAPDRHRFVLTNHHIVLDGWSMPILMREIFAAYYGQRLTAPVPYRRFITWLADRDFDAARAAWRHVLDGFDTPTLVGPADRLGLGRRGVESFRLPEETTQAVVELARSQHTTVSTVLQAAFAQLLMWLTGQHDVAFGTVVSGRPADLDGADSILGLLINTVPVRARITPTTSTADLLDQLQNTHGRTLEHEHLALREIHRIADQEQLFDTVFVYENYPIDPGQISSVDGLTISDLANRDCYHYPLTIQAVPGSEIGLRVQFRTDVFDAESIEALIDRFQRMLVTMTADPTRPLTTMDLLDEAEYAQLDGFGNQVPTKPADTAMPEPGDHDTGGRYHGPANLVEQILADIYAQVLGIERVGVHESFFDLGGDSLSAMRAIAAINTALDIRLPVPALFDAPSVRSLSQQLHRHVGAVEESPASSRANDL
ncbi:condensation domain-containing protein, partial [Mycobacterium noviomagense]